MANELRLVPDQAAASIAARVKVIENCKTMIRETVKRYDGLKAFEDQLAGLGVKDAVDRLMKED
jgi:hypothetical protein